MKPCGTGPDFWPFNPLNIISFSELCVYPGKPAEPRFNVAPPKPNPVPGHVLIPHAVGPHLYQ